jgi:hypothetical protein
MPSSMAFSGLAGMLLLFLVLVEWWTAVLEKVSTMG